MEVDYRLFHSTIVDSLNNLDHHELEHLDHLDDTHHLDDLRHLNLDAERPNAAKRDTTVAIVTQTVDTSARTGEGGHVLPKRLMYGYGLHRQDAYLPMNVRSQRSPPPPVGIRYSVCLQCLPFVFPFSPFLYFFLFHVSLFLARVVCTRVRIHT